MIEKRVAIITGATRGIGLAIAKRLAQDGIALSLCGRNEEALKHLQEEMGKGEASFLLSKTDVSDAKQVEALVEKTLDKFGKVDILVNNAGITSDSLLIQMRPSDWERVLATNLTGAFLVTRLVAKEMIRARAGRIVNIASVVGIRGNAGQAAYVASKAGLIGLTKTVARELASRGITCNAVAPGFIETDMTGALPESVKEKMLSEIPLGRFGKAGEVAELVRFLVSEESGYLTGQVIRIDGGMVTS